MKIVHIIPDLACGGAEKACIQLCNYMEQFHDIYLISLCDHDETKYPVDALSKGIKFITLGKHAGFNPFLFIRLYRVLKSISPSVIHTHMAALLYASPFILRHHRLGVFYTVHTFVKMDAPLWYRYFYSFLLRLRAFQMVANSMAVLNNMKKVYSLSQGQYIYLGTKEFALSVDHLKVMQEVKTYKPSEQTRIFIHVGRIIREKNQMLLYKAFHQLIDEGYDIILLILGEIQSASIFKQLEDLSRPRICYLGRKNNVADYLVTAEAFCLTSEYEGLSLATIEAMSMKVIPICTPAGGVEEVVKDGYNGFLSEDHTVEGYVRAIKRYFALGDSDREIMRENALHTYKEHFTIERCGKAYLGLYEEEVYKNSISSLHVI